MGKRTFEEISVVATGVQSTLDRFGRERRLNFDAPQISQWRSNLTGLSQTHNLYFVAYGPHIHVYVPEFPTQRISEQPALVFTSQPSATGLPGYIDQRTPHAVNNLIVQFLGNEEVIAAVRDDGDVDAFLVRHIVQAVDRRKAPDSTIGKEGDEIKPFFQSNVGISAWGLAIHSQARILATSSNAHEIRVFKFGLLHTEDEEQQSSDDETVSDAKASNNVRSKGRKTDVTHHVLNGETNIPYIAFCNTGDDPDAKWLLTTDISGVCRVMDLHSLQPVQAFRFGRTLASNELGGFDRLNAGWAIMFLDTRSFRLEHDAYAALGVDEAVDHTLPRFHGEGDIWDLSNTVRRLKESSEPFIYHPIQYPAGRLHSPRLNTRDEETEDSSASTQAQDESTESVDSSDGGASVDIEIDISEETREEDIDGPRGIEVEVSDPMHMDVEDVDEQHGYESLQSEEADEVMDSSPSAFDSDEYQEADLVDDDEDPEYEGTEDNIPYTALYSGESTAGNEARFIFPTAQLCDDLPCPILHASVRNIYLLQPSNHKLKEVAFMPPMMGFANPLRQTVHQQFEYLRIFERLNMNAYIPSLGIVVLASQKGRALVLSLTKLRPNATYPKEMQRQMKVRHDAKTIYCMRMECILPFEHQEKANQRSYYPLHGIATGPLQGSKSSRPHLRRYRLMMMYQDHSILSYEIGRKQIGTRDSGVDVSSLVV